MRSLTRVRLVSAALLGIASPLGISVASAQVNSQAIRGTGYADIQGDASSVRAMAEADARRSLVRAMLEDAVGSDRAAGVEDAVIQSLADQIQPAMIMSQEGQREGTRYKIVINANMDRAWFTTQLRIKGISTTSQLAGGSERLIFVVLDQASGVGRNYSKPQEVITDYHTSKGASFSDKSISASSEKEKAASSYGSKSGTSVRGSNAGAYHHGQTAAAERSSFAGATASSEKGAAAYSSSSSSIEKNNVQAEVHDDMQFHQEVRMQKVETRTVPAEYALNAVSRELVNYGVAFADAGPMLNSFFGGKRPLWSSLMQDARLAAFEKSLAAKNGAFFMGGSFAIQDTASEGLFACTGTLDARVAAISTGQVIASGSANGSASDINSAERCEAKLAEKLAVKVTQDMGPQIKLYWMDKIRLQK